MYFTRVFLIQFAMLVEDFTFTKEDLFKLVSQEAIMNYYLGQYNIYVGNDRYNNPFRNDRNGDCVFFYSNGKLYFHDYAENCYDIFDIVIRKKRLKNFGQALRHIQKDVPNILAGNIDDSHVKVDITKTQKVSRDKKNIRIKRKKFDKYELRFWNIGGLTVNPEELEANKIYSLECFWINDSIYSSLFMNYAYHYGGYKYQIYRPNKPKGKKFISVPCLIGDEEFLPPTATHLVITKSKKDAFFLRKLGVNAIHVLSESILISDEKMKEYYERFEVVFTLFDNDSTGIKASKKYKKAFGTIALWYPREVTHKLKDTYDNLKHYGYQYMLDLILFLREKYNID